MTNATIEGIFPVPIYTSNIGRDFAEHELLRFNELKKSVHKNEGNTNTVNSYVLKEFGLSVLHDQILEHVNCFFEKVYMPDYEIKPYITQSWLNFTEENQYHHQHEHPNSIVSGVLYIDADKELDKIRFFKTPRYDALHFHSKEFGFFNSKSWDYTVSTGDLILFPSSTTHSVIQKKGKNIRTSLAFNTFVKGHLGDERMLTELKL